MLYHISYNIAIYGWITNNTHYKCFLCVKESYKYYKLLCKCIRQTSLFANVLKLSQRAGMIKRLLQRDKAMANSHRQFGTAINKYSNGIVGNC